MKKSESSQKKLSLFNSLIFLVAITAIIIFYISNIIYINRIVMDNNNIKDSVYKAMQNNLVLKKEIDRLSSFERIRNIVSGKMNLNYRPEAINDVNTIRINKVKSK
jgi:cell division protein FtsL